MTAEELHGAIIVLKAHRNWLIDKRKSPKVIDKKVVEAIQVIEKLKTQGVGGRSKEDILSSMEEEMPYLLDPRFKPYILEAMEIYKFQPLQDQGEGVLLKFAAYYNSQLRDDCIDDSDIKNFLKQ